MTAPTCVLCGRELDDDFYMPIRGRLPNGNDAASAVEVKRPDDSGYCSQCVWEIETGTPALPTPGSRSDVYTHLFVHAEHAVTVIERLEGRLGERLQPTEPDLPGQQVIEIGRSAPGA